MKIRIITHHSVHNHGAMLQLYALMRVLKKKDETVCALDYNKNFDFLEKNANFKYDISIKSIPFYLKFLIKNGMSLTLFNVKKKLILDCFKKKNKMVGEFYSHCKNIDVVFVGSDEVFSIEPGLNPFFWGMGVVAKYIVAYAGCFGPTTLPFIYEKHADKYIRAGIETFDCISVRDSNSQEIIETLSGNRPIQLCDPVILYGFENEKNSFKRPMREKYLLVYAYDNNMNGGDEVFRIKEYAKANHYRIVTAGFFHAWCDKCVNVTPIQLLQWIKFAECVITDTFHGTVMSIIMNVQFVTKIRSNRYKIGFLLSEYCLEDREIMDFAYLAEIFRKKIDFDKVNYIIKEKRIQGMKYINECIFNAENVQ